MTWRRLLTLYAAIVTAGCGELEQTDAHLELHPAPVVVYASYEDETYLSTLFAGFTKQTGIRVTVRHADTGTIVGDVIADRGSPRADLLLTSTANGVWRAAEEGALRPVGSEAVKESVPGQFRDPDNYWTAVTLRSDANCFRRASDQRTPNSPLRGSRKSSVYETALPDVLKAYRESLFDRHAHKKSWHASGRDNCARLDTKPRTASF